MSMLELCPLCVEMDAMRFLNEVIVFGLEFKTVEKVVEALKLYGARESELHLNAVAVKYLEVYQ